MMVTISSDEPRSIRAIEIAAAAGQWLKCHTRDGRKAYGVPSQCSPGRYYLVTSASCDCPDFARRRQACKHVMAVQLHCALVQGSRSHRRSAFVATHVNGAGETVYLPRRESAALSETT